MLETGTCHMLGAFQMMMIPTCRDNNAKMKCGKTQRE